MEALTETEAIASEREMLVRFCARSTGDPDAAEDLAQQTLLEAWRHQQQLRDPQARQSWLFSIARNVCVGWGRGRARQRARYADATDADGGGRGHALVTEVDLEIELDRDELAGLLDRAMALLPPEVRDVLVRRYVEEHSQAEVAARLGLTEGAVEARLHRGKLRLKRLLTTELSNEAIAHGLIAPADAGWEETRLWCPGCGRRKLEGRLEPDKGELLMRCPGCDLPFDHYINSSMRDGLQGAQTFKPAVSRVLQAIHDRYHVRPVDGVLRCGGCGEPMPIRRSPALGIYLLCRPCQWCDNETWHSLTWSLPQVRQFWRENPRMRFLPEREIEVEGSPAVLTGFESVTGNARLEVVSLRDTCRVLCVRGAIS